MWLLVSWAHCCSTVKSSLADSDHLHDWLKKLTLLVPEVRSGGEMMNNCYLVLSSSCFSFPYLKT
jgi:ubiquitin carboxyl-terminal hydrolase 34